MSADLMTIQKPLCYKFFYKEAPRLAHAMYAAAMVCKMKPGDQISAERNAAVICEHGLMKMLPEQMVKYLRIVRRKSSF